MSEYIVTCDDEEASWIGNEVDSMKPIARCRDCKRIAIDQSDHDYRESLWCGLFRMDVSLDGFCAWGERRASDMALKMPFREMFGTDEDYVDDAESLAFEFLMEFGDMVLNQIDRQGMNQKELAERAGMDTSRLSKILSGNSNPTVKTLERIAIAAGLEMTHASLNVFGTNAVRYNKRTDRVESQTDDTEVV